MEEEEVNEVVKKRERRTSRSSRPVAVVSPYFEDSESEDNEDETSKDNDDFGASEDLSEESKDEETDTPVLKSPTKAKKDVRKQGYLSKKGGKNNNQRWKKRWFTFNGTVLMYFPNKKSKVSLRIIHVAQMKDVIASNSFRPQSRSSANELFGLSARQYQFSLECRHRTFVLGTDTLDNCQQWQSSLMAAIIDYQKTGMADELVGGEMNCPDKSGSIRFNKNKKKYFVALKGGVFRYYYNEEDFAIDSPIHELNVSLIRVIEIDKLTLQIDSPPAQRFILHFDALTETVSWKTHIEDAVADVLGDDQVFDIVKQTIGNDVCADCGSKDPKWSSINLGIVICIKCAGPHRSIGAHKTKVRSLRMDNIFKKNNDLVRLLAVYGNDRSNHFWAQSDTARTIDDNTPDCIRQKHIEEKYRDKKFIEKPLDTEDELNKALLRAVQSQDIVKAMNAVFSGADVNYRSEELEETVMEIAAKTENSVLKLFFELNSNTDFRTSQEEPSKTEAKGRKSSVYFEGFLEKTGPNLRGFLKRWCVLHYGIITYYADKTKPVEKGCVDLSNATSLSSVVGNREHSFDIGTSVKGRVYRFAAPDKVSMQKWFTLLSKVIGPEDAHVEDDINMVGHFYCKFHNTPKWTKVWLVLHSDKLRLECMDKEMTEVLELSKEVKCFECKIGKHVEKTTDNNVMNNNHRVELVSADMASITRIQGTVIKDTKKLYSLLQQIVS